VAKTDLAETPAGTELFDVQDKVFPDIQAEEGETAFTFMHTVPYEGSVGLVNLLTTTRVQRKAINNQIRTFLDEGGTVYACRFACGALYGFPEDFLMEGVTPFHPLDVLDAALTAWRGRAFQLNTWTV
jgi:hypothetical protein